MCTHHSAQAVSACSVYTVRNPVRIALLREARIWLLSCSLRSGDILSLVRYSTKHCSINSIENTDTYASYPALCVPESEVVDGGVERGLCQSGLCRSGLCLPLRLCRRRQMYSTYTVFVWRYCTFAAARHLLTAAAAAAVAEAADASAPAP